jgi:hypothetical protein
VRVFDGIHIAHSASRVILVVTNFNGTTFALYEYNSVLGTHDYEISFASDILERRLPEMTQSSPVSRIVDINVCW